jgi:cellulose synthase/poly-beta-1,6-N-acetylglucosamine synthase-like glycosyltransferase
MKKVKALQDRESMETSCGAKKSITSIQNMNKKDRSLVYFILFAIVVIWLGKTFFVQTDNLSLYLYGVLVTTVLLINFYFAFYKYQDQAILAEKIENDDLEKGKQPARPLVSCMVAVYNEEEIVEQCVLSLIQQSYSNKEIIFVNDGSTDGTGAVLDRYAKDGRIRVIHQKNAGKKRALGRAMREAKGSIFAFSDSDSIWADNAIEKIVRIFNIYSNVGGVSGHFRLKNSGTNFLTKAQDAWAEGQFAIRKAFESYFGAVTCISGPLAVFRREAIYNFIPAWEQDQFLGQEFKFATDRTLTGFLLGNKYISKKIKEKYADDDCVKNVDYPEKEWQVVYSKSARSWTVLPDNFRSLTKQHVRWKKSFIRNTFFTGSFYWRKPLIPAFVYYLHVAFVFIGPFIAIRHIVYLPLRGNIWSAILYIGGILFIGFMFGFAYRLENKNCRVWMYRPLMSILSTLYLSFLIFYSAFTIKKMVWHRG